MNACSLCLCGREDQMIKIEQPDFNEFINRAKNFHTSHAIFQDLFSANTSFFKELYELTTSLVSDIKDANKFCRHEMLDEVLLKVHNLVISYNNAFSVFDENSFLKLCPDYLDEFKDEIVEYLDSNDTDTDIRELINLKFYYDVYDACFFTSICNFLLSSSRCKSMTLRELVYKNSPAKYSEHIPQRASEVTKDTASDDETIEKWETYYEFKDELDREVDAFKKWKSRHLSNSDNYFSRLEWSAIPVVLEHEISTIYYLAELPDNLATDFKNITNLYNLLHKERKQPDDTNHQSKLGDAFDKTDKRISKMKYTSFIEIGKYLIQRINEKEKFYGISLYRFEMQYNFYSIINDVNHLLHTDDEDECETILADAYLLKDIHFKEIKNAFRYIDDYSSTAMYVSLFRTFMGFVNMASSLVLDVLVDKGLLGDDWDDFLLETLNGMADKVIFNPDNIDYDYVSKPIADACYKGILAASIARYDL